jgi:hypothetical protein
MIRDHLSQKLMVMCFMPLPISGCHVPGLLDCVVKAISISGNINDFEGRVKVSVHSHLKL